MAVKKGKINRPTGLPLKVNMDDKEQVRQVLERLMEIVREWNGEMTPEARLVTVGELV